MVASFNMDGKLDFSIGSLKFETRTLANISAYSLTIFVEILVSWQALKVSNFRISLRISFLCILEKEKGSLRGFFVGFSYSKYTGMVPIFCYTF